MSFDELLKTDYAPKQEEVKLKAGNKELVFTAHELSVTQRLLLEGMKQNNDDWGAKLIALSIKDQDGKHMTLKQAEQLDDDYATQFFVAALKVNFKGDAEKN